MKKFFLLILLTVFIPLGFIDASSDNEEEIDNDLDNSTESQEEDSLEELDKDEGYYIQEDEIEENFYKAVVSEIVEDKTIEIEGEEQKVQILKVKFLEGPDNDEEVEIEYGSIFSITDEQKLRVGEKVIVSKTIAAGEVSYYIEDRYRINTLIIASIVFAIIIIVFGRIKGLTSLLGLAFSFFVLVKFIVPKILDGNNPLIISFIGSLMIMVVSLYLAHGFNKKTSVALLSSGITLILAFAIALAFVFFVKLTGTGSEGAVILQSSGDQAINLRGLLLGGIIIGALGVLDDVTVGQTAVVAELKDTDKKLSNPELYLRSLRVGREHVASMVNTLVLAYAGTALPLFILFTQSSKMKLWITINSEFVAEEIVRSLVGSMSLALAVPIATFVAVLLLGSKKNGTIKEKGKS